MPKVELIETTTPASEKPEMASQTAGSLLMSTVFWLTLMIAAGMYATVSLSPKLAEWILVKQQYSQNATRLQQLEDDADYLERVAAALTSDPEFARRLVRAAQNPAENSEFVPVSQDLMFGGSAKEAKVPSPVVRPEVAALIFHFAADQQHRQWLLISATGLTLLAFTLMNDAGAGMLMAVIRSVTSTVSLTLARYRKPQPPEEVETSLE